MTSKPKIRSLAQLWVGKYRDDALAVVTERGVGRVTVEDYRLAVVWTRVAEAVHKMLPDAKPERSIWHTQVPLKELMDDPLMNVVVHDNVDRRCGVHETLLDAKRKVQ